MIQKLKETREDLLALRISGKLDEADYKEVHSMVKPVVENNEKPCLYFEIDNLEGVTPKAVYERLKDQQDFNQFHKVAIVGDKNWQEAMVSIIGSIMKSKGRFFEPEEKEDAFNWLKN